MKGLKILVVGEAFVDIFPKEHRIGGAPLNFAVHCAGLGSTVFFAARVGDDVYGREIAQLLKNWDIDCQTVQIDPRVQTGQVLVAVDAQGEPSFTIIGESAHDYLTWDGPPNNWPKEPFDLLYFGTMGSRHPVARKAIRRIIQEQSPKTKTFFDVNLRGKFYTKDLIEHYLHLAHFVKLNGRELDCLAKLWQWKIPPTEALRRMANDYHIDHICLTQGAQGGVALHQGQIFTYRAAECKNLVNTMGAGDAFSGALAMGLLQGWAIETTLRRAAQLASDICQVTGAIPASSIPQIRQGGR